MLNLNGTPNCRPLKVFRYFINREEGEYRFYFVRHKTVITMGYGRFRLETP